MKKRKQSNHGTQNRFPLPLLHSHPQRGRLLQQWTKLEEQQDSNNPLQALPQANADNNNQAGIYNSTGV